MQDAAAGSLGAESAAIVFRGDGADERLEVTGPWRGQVAASVPLAWGDRRYGLLFLGPRASGEPYRRDDFQVLSQVTGQVVHVIRMRELAWLPAERHPITPADGPPAEPIAGLAFDWTKRSIGL